MSGPTGRQDTPESRRPRKSGGRIRSALAPIALALAAAALSFTLISNSDFFWQLASGEWMLDHGEVLDFDPFGINPQDEWVNVHWGFQIVIAALHKVGGFGLLTLLKSALPALTLLIFALHLRKRVPSGWLMFSGVALLTICVTRLRLRPELFSLMFMVLIIVLLEGVRLGGNPRRLWWAVPIMIAWVNMHGLYVIALGLIWSSVLGAWIDRAGKREAGTGGLLSKSALGPLLAATLGVLITPWPVEAALHPVLLWERISGSAIYYTYGVSELIPTWRNPGAHLEAIVLVVMTAAAMTANRKRLPLSHVIWAGAMLTLAALARRNVGLMGPVFGFLLAWHGGETLARLKGAVPWSGRIGQVLTGVMGLAVIALIFAASTSAIWRWAGWDRRFGAGLQTERYPIACARFLRKFPGKGNLFCTNFGDSGCFIYHTFPKRKTFMDGRLEAHSQERFIEQVRVANSLRTPGSAERTELGETIRFVFVRSDARETLTALSQTRRFKLIYLDHAGACFGRTDWYLDTSQLGESNLDQFDVPLSQLTALEKRGGRRSLFSQNPAPLNYQVGSMLLSLGQRGPGRERGTSRTQERCVLLAIRYLTGALEDAIAPGPTVRGTLAQGYQQRALQCDVVPGGSLPADMNSVRALYLYRNMDLSDLSDPQIKMFAQQQVVAMQQARQIDEAADTARTLLTRLDPQQQISPPRDYLELRDLLVRRVELSRIRAEKIDPDAPLLEHVDQLTGPAIGLITSAIAKLQSAADRDGEAELRLGDLMLRRGMVREARKSYAAAAGKGTDPWKLKLRDALCLWGEGDLASAARELKKLSADRDDALARYYHAVLLELLGKYEDAIPPADGTVETDDRQLQRLLERIRGRLAARIAPAPAGAPEIGAD